MDLILWRHADAENGYPDQARKLTAKGEKQAQRMAAWLKPRLPHPTRILVSPARRAQQTARALSEDFETLPEMDVGAGAGALLTAAGWPQAEGAVLVVGHQPTLGEVAAFLLAGNPVEWSVKKSGVWWLSVDEDEQVVLRAVMSPEFL